MINNRYSTVYSSPNAAFRPLSTPPKPINARLSRPAATSTMAIPRMPLGICTRAICSLIPAKTVSAKAKPNAVEKA